MSTQPKLGGAGSATRLLRAQTAIMRAHASGASLRELFVMITEMIETEIQGSRATILRADLRRRTLSMVAGPNLPEEFFELIQNSPVGDFGTCARAAEFEELIVVFDAFEDPAWAPFRDIVDKFGLRASWSLPTFDLDGALLGTVGLYFEEPRRPTEEEFEVFRFGSSLVGVLISHEQTQEAIIESEATLRSLVENAKDSLLMLTNEGRIEFATPQAKRLFGATDLLGTPLADLVAQAQAMELNQAMRTVLEHGNEVIVEEIRALSAAPVRWLRIALTPRGDEEGLVAVVSDVSRRKAIESHLQFTERMSTVGTLAAGVAHEINNPVAYISGNLTFIREALEQLDELNPDILAAIDDSIDGTERVTEIVNDLQRFARSGELEQSFVDVAAVVHRCVRLVGHEARRNAALSLSVHGDPIAYGDETEIAQVVVNLLVNASQAIESRGTISVTVRALEDWAEITIQDDGRGMDPNVVDRIFEPFFTTRDPDSGTGLGLSVVHAIVDRHRGSVSVDSAPSTGTTVTVRLPNRPSEESLESEQKPKSRLLFVDDEASLGRTVHRLLASYEVIFETSPLAAYDRLQSDRDFDVILLDLIMPELSGGELYELISRTWPELRDRVVFVTGGAFSSDSHELAQREPKRILTKPFDRAELTQFVDRLVH